MRPNTSSRPPTSSARPKSKRQKTGAPTNIDSANAQEEVEELNFRIKDRNAPVAPRGILDTIRDSVVSRGPDQKIDVKETLKRPLTGLFRRRQPAPPTQPSHIAASIQTQSNQPNNEGVTMDAESDGSPDTQRRNLMNFDDSMSVLNLKGVSGVGGLDVSEFNAVDFGKFEDIVFLARLVCFEQDISDEQEPWTWDAMFASVTSEMREEWANEESDEEESFPNTFGNP